LIGECVGCNEIGEVGYSERFGHYLCRNCYDAWCQCYGFEEYEVGLC
jgi:hypothetical protein